MRIRYVVSLAATGVLVVAGLLWWWSMHDEYAVASPDGELEVVFSLDEGVPHYRAWRSGREVIASSRLGLELADELSLAEGFGVATSETSTFDETWTQPWGEQAEIRNHYNELRVDLDGPGLLSIVFRVFDDGIGFRYEIPDQDGLDEIVIIDELTEFAFTGDHTSWWIPAYEPNRYEYLYTESTLSELAEDQADGVHTPLTMKSEDGLHISLHEAALVDYSSMTLRNTTDTTLKADLVPWFDGTLVNTSAPMVSPWRTIQLADTAGGLITSYLILNLNEPNAWENTSWIEPGKYVGVWWEMHLGISTWGSGPNHGATTGNAMRYIDFAAEHGFAGVLVEGWNLGWDGNWAANGDKFDFTTAYDDFDIEQVSAYAQSKGVYLIGHHETAAAVHNYETQLDDALGLYGSLGVRAVKTGYVGFGQGIEVVDDAGQVIGLEWHHGQHMVRHHQRVVEEAARNEIMVNIHEPIKDTGLRRTYPNLMTREGARGQEYNAWDPDGGNPPDHVTILPFTRMLSGPMDYTPGVLDLLLTSGIGVGNRVNHTLAKELALSVVLYSPLQMAADLPENYEGRPAFQFIVDVPADWAETRVLNGEIGDHVTMVRRDRNSDEWFLGSITDEEARSFDVPLDFLDLDRDWVAEVYADGAGADWETAPLELDIGSYRVDPGSALSLDLAAGGGAAIRFRPADTGDDDLPVYGSTTG